MEETARIVSAHTNLHGSMDQRARAINTITPNARIKEFATAKRVNALAWTALKERVVDANHVPLIVQDMERAS